MSEKYQPSSGTEGCWFQDKFCNICEKDRAYREDPDNGEGCRIAILSMIYSTTDQEYPKEWIYDSEGNPTCTAFELELTKEEQENPNPMTRCTKTADMFGGENV